MENLIVESFKEILDIRVRATYLPDDEIDYGIFFIGSKEIERMSNKELTTYAPDYAITRVGKNFNEWIYMIGVNHQAIIKNNEVVFPPDFELIESKIFYNSSVKALEELLINIVKDHFGELKKEWNYGVS